MEKTTAEDQSDELVQSRESLSAPDLPPQEHMQSVVASERTWWMEGVVQSPPAQAQSAAPRWDFSSISFPDLGSRRSRSVCLKSPDHSLLPGALEVGNCDVTPWLSRLNMKQEKLSRRDRERQKERDRYRRDVNSDREVRRCRNWAEYLQLLEERRRRRQKDRPAHLWEREVTPLTQPGQCASHRKNAPFHE